VDGLEVDAPLSFSFFLGADGLGVVGPLSLSFNLGLFVVVDVLYGSGF
jgi:hypothetical protein